MNTDLLTLSEALEAMGDGMTGPVLGPRGLSAAFAASAAWVVVGAARATTAGRDVAASLGVTVPRPIITPTSNVAANPATHPIARR